MTTLTVPRSLVANTNPTETQFDTMRDGLLDFFNNQEMDEDNLGTGGLLYSSLNKAIADNATMKWESDDAILKYVSADDKFVIQNTEGSLIFGLKEGATYTPYMTLSETGTVTLRGSFTANSSTGSQDVDYMWLLSRYRKPRLVYVDDNIVTLETNGPTDTYVMGRDRLWKVYDTTCSLAVNANGETSGDTGTAVSGLGAGLTRTDNKWYYIYAVEVQYGTQADGVNCILVATTTSPLAANLTTLDTAFGSQKWIYMGCIRNGFNDDETPANNAVIVPFKVEENGYMMFTTTVEPEGRGLNLAYGTASTNLEYTVDTTNNDADSIPPVATRMTVTGHRSELGFELHYREVSSSENHAITTACYHPTGSYSLTGIIQLEVPVLTGYKVVVVIGNTSTDRRICLAGFMDHFV